jgi:hypothetical protein
MNPGTDEWTSIKNPETYPQTYGRFGDDHLVGNKNSFSIHGTETKKLNS